MKDTQKHQKLLEVVQQHQKIRKKVGTYLREVDRRKLWAEKGYRSLSEFCEKEYGYDIEDLEEMGLKDIIYSQALS
jgi:hypothetical protein